jgi:hypothetical protein
MKKVLFATLCICTTLAVAQSQTAKVSGYVPYDSGGRQILIFQLQGNVSGGCNTTARFAIDSTSLRFKSTQAALMAAFHTQSNVTVAYSQTCSAWSNSWDIAHLCVGIVPC